jgi:hypothetical protein
MLALGQKAFEPRFCPRGRIGAGHAQHVEAMLAGRGDERVLEGGFLWKSRFFYRSGIF